MVRIRLAKKEDLPALASIYTKVYNSLDIGESWDEKSALGLITFLFKDQQDLFFVAEVEHAVIGAIVATVRPWWDGNHLIESDLFVAQEFQGQKIGVKLIETLFTTAKDKYQVVAWDTYTHTVHKHPLNWYKDLGFEEIGHWTMITGDVAKVLQNIKSQKR